MIHVILSRLRALFSDRTCPATGRPCPHPGDCGFLLQGCRAVDLELGRRT